MTTKKKIFIFCGAVIFLLVGAVIFLNWYVKKEVNTMLKTELLDFEYEDLTINVLGGNSSVLRSVIDLGETRIEAEDISLRNLDYSSYFFNDEIVIERIIITRPMIVTNRSDSIPVKKSGAGDKPGKNIKIKELEISGGSYRIVKNEEGQEKLYLSLDDLKIYNIEINDKRMEGQLPFNHKNFTFHSDSLFLEMDEEHNINVEFLNFSDDTITIEGFEIIPKYGKGEFDRQISSEKDRVELLVQNITLKDLAWTYKNERLSLKSPYAEISEADLKLYRNKLLPDDEKIKPLYGEMLREMEVKLSLDSIAIKGSSIQYEEKVSNSRPAGIVNFTGVSGYITNLTNIDLEREDFPVTRFEAEALFAGKSRLTLDLDFRINDENDNFNASGSFAGIEAEEINSFVVPAAGLKVEGEIESMFYNFAGNSYRATGDMQLSYRDFKVSILKDGKEESKGLLSSLANLILKNDVVDEDVSQESIQVERDRTKSFWNFLWLCIREGALKTFF